MSSAAPELGGQNLFATDLRAAVARGDLGPMWQQGGVLDAAREAARRRTARGADQIETLIQYATLAAAESQLKLSFEGAHTADPLQPVRCHSGNNTLTVPLPALDAPSWAFDVITAMVDQECAHAMHSDQRRYQADGWRQALANVATQAKRDLDTVRCIAQYLETARVALHYEYEHPGSAASRGLAMAAVGWAEWYTPPETQGPLAALSFELARLDSAHLPWVTGTLAEPNPDGARWASWAKQWAPRVQRACVQAGRGSAGMWAQPMQDLWTAILADLPDLRVDPPPTPQQQKQQQQQSDMARGDMQAKATRAHSASLPMDGDADELAKQLEAHGQTEEAAEEEAPGSTPGTTPTKGKQGGDRQGNLPPPPPLALPGEVWDPLAIGARALAPGKPGAGQLVPPNSVNAVRAKPWQGAHVRDVIAGTDRHPNHRGTDRGWTKATREAQNLAGGGALAAAVAKIRSLDRVQWSGGAQRGRLDPRALARFASGLNTTPFRHRTTGRAPKIGLVMTIDTSSSMNCDPGLLAKISGCACAVADAVKRCGGDAVLGTFSHRILNKQQWPHVESLPELQGADGTPTELAMQGALLELNQMSADIRLLIHFADGGSNGGAHKTLVRRIEGAGHAVVGVYYVEERVVGAAPLAPTWDSLSEGQQAAMLKRCSSETEARRHLTMHGLNAIGNPAGKDHVMYREQVADQAQASDPLWRRKAWQERLRSYADQLSEDLGGVPACAISHPKDLARTIAPLLASLVANASLRGAGAGAGAGARA